MNDMKYKLLKSYISVLKDIDIDKYIQTAEEADKMVSESRKETIIGKIDCNEFNDDKLFCKPSKN